MKESTVKDLIIEWLEARWRKSIVHNELGVDFLVFQWSPTIFPTWIMGLEQIECKGTNSDVHRAIGQSLDYYFNSDCIPTYLAVPEDYKQLKILEQIMGFFSLPIGILLVDSQGKISVKREAKGKTRCCKLLEKKKGTLTTLSAHPTLHYLGTLDDL